MGYSRFLSKDILNIVSLRVWKSYLRKLNNEFKQVYFISFYIKGENYDPPRHSYGHSIQWYIDIKSWYFNGKLHRNENQGPALKRWGYKYWYFNDQLHRKNGPAMELTNGTKFWYNKGQLHRNDGPAIEMADGRKYWYINGNQLSETEFNNGSL